MHDDYDLRQEQMNKYSLLSSKKFLETLLETFTDHVVHSTGALVISAMLDFLTFSLCAPYSETTDGTHFDTLLEMVAANGRIVFKLFQVRLQKLRLFLSFFLYLIENLKLYLVFNIKIIYRKKMRHSKCMCQFKEWKNSRPISGTQSMLTVNVNVFDYSFNNDNFLFCLQHPSMAVVKGAGLVMKAIIEVGFKVIHKRIIHVHGI